jgi:hypothetical protein
LAQLSPRLSSFLKHQLSFRLGGRNLFSFVVIYLRTRNHHWHIGTVRLAYQPPANSTFLSKQTSNQQPANSTFLSEQISTSHQPPAKRTGWIRAKEQHFFYPFALRIFRFPHITTTTMVESN